MMITIDSHFTLIYGAVCAAFLLGVLSLFVWGFARRKRQLKAYSAQPDVQVRGKWSKTDVVRYARQVLGAAARYDEVPTEGDPTKVYGIVSHPERWRIVNLFDRYAPNEGRRRMVQKLSDPVFLAKTVKGPERG